MDKLEDLPVSSEKSVPEELKLLQKYLKDEGKRNALVMELKDVLYASALFAVMSIPWFDRIIDALPWCGSPLIKFGIKVVIFAVLLYVILLISRR